jgi:glycosyltransferase involved in cell wall biosynthesis
MSYYHVSPDRLFQFYAAQLERFTLAEAKPVGPIMSVGVAKRDYPTLLAALADLPGYETEIYASSKYGDLYKGKLQSMVPQWVHFMNRISDEEMVRRYQCARFVVIPLVDTTHSGAGVSVALEASASGQAVISTQTAGMASYVIDGETGLLVAPHDYGAMRDAIHKLWTQPDLAREMGLAGRRHVETHFNPGTVDSGISGKSVFRISSKAMRAIGCTLSDPVVSQPFFGY